MAQLASASGLGPEGPVFESQYPDKAEAEMLPLFLCDILIALWDQRKVHSGPQKVGAVGI